MPCSGYSSVSRWSCLFDSFAVTIDPACCLTLHLPWYDLAFYAKVEKKNNKQLFFHAAPNVVPSIQEQLVGVGNSLHVPFLPSTLRQLRFSNSYLVVWAGHERFSNRIVVSIVKQMPGTASYQFLRITQPLWFTISCNITQSIPSLHFQKAFQYSNTPSHRSMHAWWQKAGDPAPERLGRSYSRGGNHCLCAAGVKLSRVNPVISVSLWGLTNQITASCTRSCSEWSPFQH